MAPVGVKRAPVAGKEVDHPAMARKAIGLGRAVQDLAEATDFLLETFAGNPKRAAAGAAHYLKLTGIVAGGWLTVTRPLFQEYRGKLMAILASLPPKAMLASPVEVIRRTLAVSLVSSLADPTTPGRPSSRLTIAA